MAFLDLLNPVIVEDWERAEKDDAYDFYRHRQHPAYALGFLPQRAEVLVATRYQGALKYLGAFFGEPSLEGFAQSLQPPVGLEPIADVLSLFAWKHQIAPGALCWSRWYPMVLHPQDAIPLFLLPQELYESLIEMLAPYQRFDHAQDLRLVEAVRKIDFTVPSSQHEALEITQRLEHHPLYVFLENT